MKQYKIKKHTFYKSSKGAILANLGVYLSISLFVLFLIYFNSDNEPIDWNKLLFIFWLIFSSLLFNIIRIIIKQKTIFKNYKLSFDDDSIISEQQDVDTIKIPNHRISVIRKTLAGTIVIIAKKEKTQKVITVPSEIEKYEEVLELLESIKPISD